MAADIGLQHDLAIGMVVEAALMAARSGTSFSDALAIIRATYC
jgi:hypothetical protein